MSLAVANRYARVLADVVLAPSSGLEAPAALGQLHQFNALVKESPELKNVLLSPAVSAGRKRSVAGKLAEQLGLHRLMKNFLYVAIDHRRVAQLELIALAFETVIDERLGRVRAQVSSAVELDAVKRAEIEAELARRTGKQVRCEFSVDPSLLGGVSARIGSTIYDGSVRGQLAALRGRLSS
ncbi:MAG: ATP synthase F1 subunit delta [Acidobacteria bacterium]|nr:ATP synthase F1 subunit delta [Acidobacteriota bacterium]